MNAAYLVDNVALLSLQEKQDGVEFHCFDMGSKVQVAEGHMGWDVLDKQSFSTLEESARVAALQKIPQLAGLTVAPVAPEMLEQMRGGRKVLWQMEKADTELENAKNIRFITSSYEDRFKIPDGSAVEIEYPNRKFSARCEYMDEYHLRLGYDVLHICQLAEMLGQRYLSPGAVDYGGTQRMGFGKQGLSCHSDLRGRLRLYLIS